MANKISNFVYLILLFLLQSCSGGTLGNFLESSFKNNDLDKTSQKYVDEELNSDMNSKDKKLLKKENETIKIIPKVESKPQNISNSFSIKKIDAKTLKEQNQNYNPRSYRVFVILKKVDPSFPTENFSKVLRNGDINFEIEKIELIKELNQNQK
tara:strand:+ start:514 stop:975 length:462 start_codon:yes stop_codon:yes gene_type:complete